MTEVLRTGVAAGTSTWPPMRGFVPWSKNSRGHANDPAKDLGSEWLRGAEDLRRPPMGPTTTEGKRSCHL